MLCSQLTTILPPVPSKHLPYFTHGLAPPRSHPSLPPSLPPGLPGFYRFYGYDMLLRLGGGVLLVLYDELKAHGAGRMRQQVMQLAARGGEGGGGSGGGSGGGGGGRQ